MGKYWLLDRHGTEEPSVLVEVDGAMRVVEVLRFGPQVSKLEDQQRIRDDVIGRLAPTLRPFVAAAKIGEQGIAVHEDLQHRDVGGPGQRGGAAGGPAMGAGRGASGAKRTGGRGRG